MRKSGKLIVFPEFQNLQFNSWNGSIRVDIFTAINLVPSSIYYQNLIKTKK